MTDVYDVAARILRRTGRTGTMKLQKLCYFAYGWYREATGSRLFSEPIEAWAHGPVVPALYQMHKRKNSVEEIAKGDPDALSEEEGHVVDAIVDFYKPLNSWDLRELSHEHDCWKRNYEDLGASWRGSQVITDQEIAKTFKDLRARSDTSR